MELWEALVLRVGMMDRSSFFLFRGFSTIKCAGRVTLLNLLARSL